MGKLWGVLSGFSGVSRIHCFGVEICNWLNSTPKSYHQDVGLKTIIKTLESKLQPLHWLLRRSLQQQFCDGSLTWFASNSCAVHIWCVKYVLIEKIEHFLFIQLVINRSNCLAYRPTIINLKQNLYCRDVGLHVLVSVNFRSHNHYAKLLSRLTVLGLCYRPNCFIWYHLTCCLQWLLLLTWFNFNPSMDK